MNASFPSSNVSIPPDGTSLHGVTELMKDTQFREFAKEMVKRCEDVGKEQEVSEAPAEDSFAQEVVRSASAQQVPVRLNLLDRSEKKDQDDLNGSQQKFLSRQGAPVVQVYAEQQAQLRPQLPRPGFLSRLSTGCLNFVQRCFGRPAG